MSGGEHESSSRHDREPAHGGAGGTAAGKSTVSGKMSGGKKRTVEEKLEALEEQNDTILVAFAPYLAAHMTKPDAPEAAAKVRTQLMKLRALADDLKRSKSTAKRKGLESAVNDALTAADVTMLTQGALVARLLDNGDDIKQAWSAQDAFGVHVEAKEREPEPEMDPAPDAPITGSETVDKGFFCEQEEHKNDKGNSCDLTERARDRLAGELQGGVSSSMVNFHAAIQNARLDALTTTEHNWGFLAEFLFAAATGPLIARAVKGFEGLRAAQAASPELKGLVGKGALERFNKDDIQALLTNASKGVRGELKRVANEMSDETRNKAAFLLVIQNQIKPMGDRIWLEAPSRLDDADLNALRISYLDDKVHSISAYADHINAVATAYAKQDVGKVGAAHGGRRLRAMKLVAHGFERWATLEEDGPMTGLETRGPGDGTLMWHGWLDDQFAGIASELYEGRTGKDVQTRDVTHGYLFLQPKRAPLAHLTELTDDMEDTLDEWREKCRRRSEGEAVVDISNPKMERPGEAVEQVDADAGSPHQEAVSDEPEDVDFEYRDAHGAAS